MPRSVLLRERSRRRRRRFASPGSILFTGSLALAQAANAADIACAEIDTAHPGHAAIGDAAQGGLLSVADAALFDVQLSESV